METEHLDVLIVGAGLSGIAAAHHVQASCPWASYAVFEGRGAIGGTWDLFRYPGVRSDSDMFTLGYSFRPWSRPESIADGDRIRQYIVDTAAAEGIDAKIRFHHRVVSASWSSDQARWHVTAERSDTAETVELTCGFLFSCSGYYRYDRGHVPDFAGVDRFAGTIAHPQFWPQDLDYSGKKVVVIGSGATAVTLVPSMAATAGHVTMLQRSPSYVMTLPGTSPLTRLVRALVPKRWEGDVLRWSNALLAQGFYSFCQRRPTAAKRMLRRGVQAQLPDGFDVDTHFTPRYDPWDQRLCLVPDGDFFKAIRRGDVDVVTDTIDTFTETGIRLTSGRELDADVVVPATGLELLFIGGIELSVDGEPVDLPDRLTYKGMMLEGLPNMAMAVGYTNASWTLKAELTCDTVARVLNHMHDTGLRQCTPRATDPTISASPLLSLSSGYIQRAADRFPKQGNRFPWSVYQSYLRDYRAMKRRPVADEGLEFSNPEPADRPADTLVAT